MFNPVGISANRSQFEAEKNKRYNEIYAHELKHKQAGGAYAGSIVIERDGNGMPIGGHVDIQMPSLSKENPSQTIQHADTVIKSAMAPSDPSDQDYKVAAQAKSIKTQAQSYQTHIGQNTGTGTGTNANKIPNNDPNLGKNIDLIG